MCPCLCASSGFQWKQPKPDIKQINAAQQSLKHYPPDMLKLIWNIQWSCHARFNLCVQVKDGTAVLCSCLKVALQCLRSSQQAQAPSLSKNELLVSAQQRRCPLCSTGTPHVSASSDRCSVRQWKLRCSELHRFLLKTVFSYNSFWT